MKYSKKDFESGVKYYSTKLKGKIKGKLLFVTVDLLHKNAFLSIAPLSKAVHSLGGEMHVVVISGKSTNLTVLKEVWNAFENKNTKKGIELQQFIKFVDKKTSKKVFGSIFRRPEFELKSGRKKFTGTINLDYKKGWHKNYRWGDLVKTSKRILQEGYALRPKESLSVGFTLIPKNKHLDLPLEDYLDSYSIALSIARAAKNLKAKVGLSSASSLSFFITSEIFFTIFHVITTFNSLGTFVKTFTLFFSISISSSILMPNLFRYIPGSIVNTILLTILSFDFSVKLGSSCILIPNPCPRPCVKYLAYFFKLFMHSL